MLVCWCYVWSCSLTKQACMTLKLGDSCIVILEDGLVGTGEI